MDIFIDCYVDSDLSGLGSGPELQEVWDKIYAQYLQLSQDGSFNEVFEIMKEINDLRAKITIANNCIDYLQMDYDKEVVDLLNVFALRCRISPEDEGMVLIEKLNQVVARMKKWFPMLSAKEKELDEIRKKSTAPGRQYFDDVFELMEQTKGYQVEASKMTVARFCRALVKLNKEAQKNANTKNR